MHIPGNISAGLISVQLNCLPPPGDGRRFGIHGGDGCNELPDNPLLGVRPPAVPYRINGDIGGENRAHMILQVDEIRGALVLLRPTEDKVGGGVILVVPRPPPINRRRGEEEEEHSDKENDKRCWAPRNATPAHFSGEVVAEEFSYPYKRERYICI